MNDINCVMLVGRLTKDAELKVLPAGTAVGNFSIAVNGRQVKKGEKWEGTVSFFDVSLWGKTAEVLSQYLVKGKQVAVTGELRQDRWEHDGKNMSKVFVNAYSIQLLGGKEGKNDSQASLPDDGFTDDIPF